MNPNAELEKSSSSYWRDEKKVQRHSKNLESIIRKLSSPVKMVVFSKVVPKPTVEILSHKTRDSVFKAQVYKALITRLRALNKERKFSTFHRLLNEVFGDQLNDEPFRAWLGKKFEIRSSKFSQYVLKWKENEFKEVRERNKIPTEIQNKIHNTWIENSIVSTDGRNGRNVVNISKRQFLQKYGEIQSNLVELTEKKNKRQINSFWSPENIQVYIEVNERKTY